LLGKEQDHLLVHYRVAGQDFYFTCSISEMEPFEVPYLEQGTAGEAVSCEPISFLNSESGKVLPDSLIPSPVSQAAGWVGGAQRKVEVYDTPSGMLLKVEGGGEFLVSARGERIGKADPREQLNWLDRQIILGPGLVLALALRGVWCLHASAVIYKETVFVFLGESGQGKSTLAAYLSKAGWQLVSDDILPVTGDSGGLHAWPHFPQLKLPSTAQPGLGFPERLPLGKICLLIPAGKDDIPTAQLLSPGETVKVLLGQTAGARMFSLDLLKRHLEFCAWSAAQISACSLVYPHRKEALPLVKQILEGIC
jgi:hypothetical protein